jgi:hypothetical protein
MFLGVIDLGRLDDRWSRRGLRSQAHYKTGLAESAFPSLNPWRFEEIMDDHFLPGANETA